MNEIYVLVKGKQDSKGKVSIKKLIGYTENLLDAQFWAYYEEKVPTNNFYVKLCKYQPERLSEEAEKSEAIV